MSITYNLTERGYEVMYGTQNIPNWLIFLVGCGFIYILYILLYEKRSW